LVTIILEYISVSFTRFVSAHTHNVSLNNTRFLTYC